MKHAECNQGQILRAPESKYSAINYPIFCFKHLHREFGIDKCNEAEKKALMEHIIRLGALTWTQIQLAPRHGVGSEKIALHSIKAGLPSSYPVTDDIHNLLALRFDGLKAMIGLRNGFIFHVFYIDRDFSLYSHG
jgi:hypothetical protein